MDYHPAADIFPMLEGKEREDLEKDIIENGLRVPILVYENKILDGRNRFRACADNDIEYDYEEIPKGSLDDPAAYVLSLNLHRRHLNPSQLAAVGVKVKEYEKKYAKERKRDSGGDVRNKTVVGNSPQPKGKARDKAGEVVGVHGRTIDDAEKVKKASKDLFAQIEKGKVTVDRAKKLVDAADGDRVQLMQAAKRIDDGEKPTKVCKDVVIANKQEPPKMRGKYEVIYADPPWMYTSGDQHSGEEQATTIGTHYPSMPLADICELPVADIAADDCVLWLWVTSPLLEEAFDVIKAWGFKYKTSMVWDKQKHNVGHYVSVRHELLLICTKGTPPKVPKLVDSVVSIPRGEHSAKPSEFRDLIKELYPKGRRVELFARESHTGWKAWGNENATK